MYKVLIVDDESTVRKGLDAVIPWETYGYEVVALAKDGQTALDLCEKHTFDLIISDIRMPGMSGLELIQHIRSFDQRVQCLILSGYADFDYAKKAIHYGVAGYLLKPIDEDELIPAILEIKKKLDEENTMKKISSIEKERKLESFILSKVLNKSIKDYSDDEKAHMGKVHGILWEKYRVLLIHIETTNLETNNLLSLKQEINRRISLDKKAVVFLHESYIGVLLDGSSYKNRDIQLFYQEVKGAMSLHNVCSVVAVGNCVNSLCEIKDSYKTALTLIRNRFFYPNNELLVKGRELIVLNQSENQTSMEIQDMIEKLYLLIEIGEEGKLETVLREIPFIKMEDEFSEEALKKLYVSVLSRVVTKLQKSNPEKEVLLVEASEKILEIYDSTNIETLQNNVVSVIKGISEELQLDQTNDQLKKLLLLIDSKYSENLKLEKLAEIFNYNSAYLGKLFKSYTGEYFNTYLDKVRIKNAKKLLLNGVKVYRVAEIVGYKNVDYFHSKFKKYEGISPSAYRRKQHMSG
ncbi:response regulator [Evansella sp. AB-rgal1]|uniref:response regulator n=1 Tax=Evansella sp. AB-rgal1 TaxID=3242696 RepID=UPI00359E029D